MPFASNVDEPRDSHTKLKKLDRKRQISYYLYVEYTKNYTNELIYETESKGKGERREKLGICD